MTSLITGICGFAGRHLAAHLVASGDRVVGTYILESDKGNLGPLRRKVSLHRRDLRDLPKMAALIRKTKPDVVYHLAAQASAALSFRKPVLTVDINVTGTVSLLEAIRQESPKTKLLYLSSADVYGLVRPKDTPVKETHPPAPRNPYAASKLAGEELCRQYIRSFGLHIVSVRVFNHTGPGQALGFVVPDFASQIANLEKRSGRRRIKVGNLDAERDLSDVRDIVRGYRLLIQKGKSGEVYHLAGGTVYRMRTILDMMLDMARVPIEVVDDPKRMRPSDLPILSGSTTKTRRITGWRPSIPIETTLADSLDYWRNHGN